MKSCTNIFELDHHALCFEVEVFCQWLKLRGLRSIRSRGSRFHLADPNRVVGEHAAEGALNRYGVQVLGPKRSFLHL
jgi:hypothetical protein